MKCQAKEYVPEINYFQDDYESNDEGIILEYIYLAWNVMISNLTKEDLLEGLERQSTHNNWQKRVGGKRERERGDRTGRDA